MLSIAVVVFCLPLGSAQQTSGTPSNAPSSSAQKPSRPSDPAPQQPGSAAQDNPFPSDVSHKAAEQQHSGQQAHPDTPPAPDAPSTPPANAGPQAPASSTQKSGDAAKENPFPEDVSRGAAAAGSGNDAASSGSSSSSSSSSGSGDGAEPNTDVPSIAGRRKLRKPSDSDIQSGSLAGEGRAQEDVRIGRFYLNDGNYQGAYTRFTEAGHMDPANLEAIYGLASAAEGLHKKHEALQNYKLYLQIAPDGERAKAAQKAIRSLGR